MEDRAQVVRRMLARPLMMDSGIPSAAAVPQHAPAASLTRAFAAQAIPAASVRLAHPIPLPLRRVAHLVLPARRDRRALPRHTAARISLIRTSAAARHLAAHVAAHVAAHDLDPPDLRLAARDPVAASTACAGLRPSVARDYHGGRLRLARRWLRLAWQWLAWWRLGLLRFRMGMGFWLGLGLGLGWGGFGWPYWGGYWGPGWGWGIGWSPWWYASPWPDYAYYPDYDPYVQPAPYNPNSGYDIKRAGNEHQSLRRLLQFQREQ